jgi:hypothetical protein
MVKLIMTIIATNKWDLGLISVIVLPLSICIERANHWAFWKAVGKSV